MVHCLDNLAQPSHAKCSPKCQADAVDPNLPYTPDQSAKEMYLSRGLSTHSFCSTHLSEDSDSDIGMCSPRHQHIATASWGSGRSSISSITSRHSASSSTSYNSYGSRRSCGSRSSRRSTTSSVALWNEFEEDIPDIEEDRDEWFAFWDCQARGGDGSDRLSQKQVVLALGKTFPTWDRDTVKEVVTNMWSSFDLHGYGSLGREELMKPQLGFVDSVHAQLMWMR